MKIIKLNKKNNQLGFAHLQAVALVLLVVSIGSFSAYRISQVSSANRAQKKADEIEKLSDISVTDAKKDQVTSIEIPEEEKSLDSVPVPATPVKKETTTTTETQKPTDRTWLKMTKVSTTQDGNKLYAVSTLPTPLTGTCTAKLYQEGYSKVYASSSITNSTECSVQLDISSLPTYSGWTFFAFFDSSDGKVSASQSEEPITLSAP